MNMNKWEIIEQVNSLLTAIPDSDPTQLEKDYVNLLSNYNKLFADNKKLLGRLIDMKCLIDSHHAAMLEVFEGAKDDHGMSPDPAFYKNTLYRQGLGWISVKDRLPEEGVNVLAFQSIGGRPVISVTTYKPGCGWWSCCLEPSHWMPLPAAPGVAE